MPSPFERPEIEQEAWLFRAGLASQVAVIATHAAGIVRRWGAGAELIFGWPADEVVGRKLTDLALVTDPVRQRRATDITRRVLSGEPWTGEWIGRRRDGEPVPVSTSHQPLCDEETGEVVGYLSITVDLSARDRFEAALLREAMHDPLTGLPNRKLLLDHLRRLVGADTRRPGSTAVLFVDLDRFKSINDRHGHSVGDVVLNEVAERLRVVVREGDVVGRLGGDEFVVLCRFGANPAGVLDIANRVAESLSRPVNVRGAVVPLSASVGVALAEPGADPEALLHLADTAMYRAKRSRTDVPGGPAGVVVLAERGGDIVTAVPPSTSVRATPAPADDTIDLDAETRAFEAS